MCIHLLHDCLCIECGTGTALVLKTDFLARVRAGLLSGHSQVCIPPEFYPGGAARSHGVPGYPLVWVCIRICVHEYLHIHIGVYGGIYREPEVMGCRDIRWYGCACVHRYMRTNVYAYIRGVPGCPLVWVCMCT